MLLRVSNLMAYNRLSTCVTTIISSQSLVPSLKLTDALSEPQQVHSFPW